MPTIALCVTLSVLLYVGLTMFDIYGADGGQGFALLISVPIAVMCFDLLRKDNDHIR